MREVLDRFGIPNRLQHVQRYVWRGGTLSFAAANTDVAYELEAHWDAPVLEAIPISRPGLDRAVAPVAEGRWTRGTARYVLRVGIDLAVPSAIYIRSATRLQSFVPFYARPPAQVEHALDADFAAYIDMFLNKCLPVPEAVQADARRCRALKL